MAVSFGFYNSRNHDRVYDAVQVSSIFDGIIQDGIIQTYRDAFAVSKTGGMYLSVAAGRAWFNHTWTLNDAAIQLQVSASGAQPRIDSVVLEVDITNRTNSIKIVRGTPASSPQPPTLRNDSTYDDGVHQYRLANVSIPAGATEIQSVADTRGTSGGSPWAAPIISGGNYVVKIGDTMAGALTLDIMKGKNNITYGATLPAAGNAGRIFFKTVS